MNNIVVANVNVGGSDAINLVVNSTKIFDHLYIDPFSGFELILTILAVQSTE